MAQDDVRPGFHGPGAIARQAVVKRWNRELHSAPNPGQARVPFIVMAGPGRRPKSPAIHVLPVVGKHVDRPGQAPAMTAVAPDDECKSFWLTRATIWSSSPPYEEPNAMTKRPYHYTESGLDSVYLQNGCEIVTSRKGKGVIIQDIDGLHEAIGQDIVGNKKKLRGKEFRFLRNELLLSQGVLGALVASEGADHRSLGKRTSAHSLDGGRGHSIALPRAHWKKSEAFRAVAVHRRSGARARPNGHEGNR